MALVVILPGPKDLGAGKAALALRRRGADAVVVPAWALESSRWSHTVTDGLSHTEIHLPDGRLLSDETVGAVVNRLAGASTQRFAASSEQDRVYACVEWEALLLAWLSGLGGRVLGCPSALSASCLPGPNPPDLRWLAWGRRCGFSGPPSVIAPRPGWAPWARADDLGQRWTVVGRTVLREDRVVGGDTASALRDLAALAGADLLDVRLRRSGAGDELAAVDLRPALTPGVCDALADELVTRVRSVVGVAS